MYLFYLHLKVIFSNSDGLHSFIESSVDTTIRLWVYSSITETIRLVYLKPEKWAGEGLFILYFIFYILVLVVIQGLESIIKFLNPKK